MQIDQNKIEQAIIEQAVSGVMNDDQMYERIKRGIDGRIDKIFSERVNDLVNAAVEAIVKEGFERSYHVYDGFGRPAGEPTSISKELEKLVKDYWTTQVGRDGKPSSSGHGTTSRAERMMLQICADDFSKEMKQHVVNVSGALKDHFRSVLNQHVAIMLSDVFKVQSQGDRDAGKPGSSSIAPPAGPIHP